MTAVVWKDKRDVSLLTDSHGPPREGYYCNERRNAIKSTDVADYNLHMWNVDNTDSVANSYTAGRRTWKWTNSSFSTCYTWSV
jgi:predicted nucleotide-binding protein (sugar kinase/HSP70/actin superfamily)